MADIKILGVYTIQHRKKDHVVTVPSIFHNVNEVVFEQDKEGTVTIRSNGND